MENIRIKIEKIEGYLQIINSMKDDCLKKFLKDPIYRGALLHYLYLIADSCISLAEMVIRHKGLRTPQSYTEAIDILGENNIIPPEFVYEFAKIAAFRNFLAHDYDRIDYLAICNDILSRMSEIAEYLSHIRKSLEII
jgi:uncharacterized protein YutE (UPF0331/DUF86 family)